MNLCLCGYKDSFIMHSPACNFAGDRRIGQRSGVVALSAPLNTSSLQVRPSSSDAVKHCKLVDISLLLVLPDCLSVCIQQTQLPSGANVTVVTTIADRYGTPSQYAIHSINVTAPSPSERTPLAYQTYRNVINATSINGTAFHRALLVAAGQCPRRCPLTAETEHVFDWVGVSRINTDMRVCDTIVTPYRGVDSQRPFEHDGRAALERHRAALCMHWDADGRTCHHYGGGSGCSGWDLHRLTGRKGHAHH